MPQTYESIATTTLSSTTSTITFSSISSAYTDLKIVFVNISTSGNQNASLTLNGDTGTNYTWVRFRGNGATASATNSTSANRIDMSPEGTSSTIPQYIDIELLSYRSTIWKTALISCAEDRSGSGSVSRMAALWKNTSAITSLTLTCNTSTWTVGTTATLYGIKNA
jgi:hypothetical protein